MKLSLENVRGGDKIHTTPSDLSHDSGRRDLGILLGFRFGRVSKR